MTACLARGAAEAFGGGGIEGQSSGVDLVSAIEAIAKLILIHPIKRGTYPSPLIVAPRLLSPGHGLVLEGVHARKPPDGLLIKLDGRLSLLAKRILLLEGRELGLQRGAVGLAFCFCHLRRLIPARVFDVVAGILCGVSRLTKE